MAVSSSSTRSSRSHLTSLNTPFQVVLPVYQKYSKDIDQLMTSAATSAEEMIKTAVVSLEDEKKE